MNFTTFSLPRFTSLFITALVLGVTLPTASAREPEVQLEINTLPEMRDHALMWGALRNGVEIKSSNLGRFAPCEGTKTHASIRLPLDADDEVELWFCVNQDDLDSYVPSVGEYYCRTSIRRGEDGWHAVVGAPWQRWTLTAPDHLLTVHYHRADEEYQGLSLWTWDERHGRQPEQNEARPVGRDPFGLVFQIDTGLYGPEGNAPSGTPPGGIGLLPRRNADWNLKDGPDRIWQPSLGATVYLLQNDQRLYVEKPDVSPKVRRVTLDADRHLTVRFSNRLPVAEWTPEKFKVSTSSGETLPVKAVYPFKHRGDSCSLYSLEVATPFEYPQKAYALDVDGFGTFNVEVGHIVLDADRFYAPDAQLGATWTPEHTTFRVFVPGALAVWVVIADAASGDAGVVRQEMNSADKGLWELQVPGDLAGKYYAYAVGGLGFDPEVEITDPYATCTQARNARSLIVNLRATDPPGFRAQQYTLPASPADAVVYELHVRDFTIAPDSGVAHKGKYLGLAESGTTLPSDPSIKTGLDHLVELGVTHVQLLPVQDFDNNETADDGYNWGYMPVHFNAPDGWYAQDPMGAGKITELKTAIQALHAHGIGVIMDVVYNHTASWASFEKLVPGYYHRMTDAGNFSNGSGCGNEFASAHPMARKFILDSVKYWVEEYRVDGFRFDLMGLIDLETMKQLKAELAAIHPGVLVYGEPWTGGATPLRPITDKEHTRGTGIGAFNDHFRDAIKGDRDGGSGGFIQNGSRAGDIVKGLMGAIHDWSQDPVDAIAYCEAHDNLTTWDKLLQSVPYGSDEVRRRMMRFAATTLFTAQGMVFIHSGQELCRSKQGNSNSYNAPDEINQIDWFLKKQSADEFAYYAGMIALRMAHPAFRLRTRGDVEQRVHFETPPDGRCVIYRINSRDLPGESAAEILVLLNGATDPVTFTLPAGEWSVYADAFRAGTSVLIKTAGTVQLPAHSGMVLMQ
ncbi:MAG TPA: type I pullulanase [Phycisphaerae bacterium]|nr:type I pullulanase [Phycisphaerales bacterium]HRX84540.1 type I pullulanase [Phycisphaerae bacterium]